MKKTIKFDLEEFKRFLKNFGSFEIKYDGLVFIQIKTLGSEHNRRTYELRMIDVKIEGEDDNEDEGTGIATLF